MRRLSRFATPALFAAALLLGACKRGDSPEDILAKDSALTRDLALANTDTSAQPELKDIPATVEPVVSETAPAPRASSRPAAAERPRREPPTTVVTRREPPPPAATPTSANTTPNGN